MPTKKSIGVTLGLVLILAVWEVSGTLVEHRNVLHEEGEDVAPPASMAPVAAHVHAQKAPLPHRING